MPRMRRIPRRRQTWFDHRGVGIKVSLFLTIILLLEHRSLSFTRANETEGEGAIVAKDNNTATEQETEALAELSAPVRDNVDWFVALLNDDGVEGSFNETDYRERFTEDFVAQVPPEHFIAVIDGLRAEVSGGNNPGDGDDDVVVWSVTEIVLSVPNGAIVRIAAVGGGGVKEGEILLNLSVDGEGRVDGLVVSPAEPPNLDDPPATVAEAADRLSRLARNFSYLVAEVEVAGDGSSPSCTVLSGSGEDEPTPIGSMFKLYVLGAVVDSIRDEDDGSIIDSWDDNVTIVDRYKSIPSGITQHDPPGTNRTVRELAERMISISDNTATDHLMALVGREAVEMAFVEYGHHDPGLNVPFLTTREMTLLKLWGKEFGDGDANTAPGPFGMAYIDAEGNVEERRNILSDLGNTSVDEVDANLAAWVAGGGRPIAVDEIEWFASPLDLCRVLSILNLDVEARRILSINPGIPPPDEDDGVVWSHVGFKGGSEPGVLGMAWYLEAAPEGDGDDVVVRRVVTGTLWDPDRPVENGMDAALLLGALRDVSLLGNLGHHGDTTDQTTAAGVSSSARCGRTRRKAWLIPVTLCVLSLTGT